ncbi:hypothetical protein NECAME_17821 [Necator americanus]|uniref:Glycosyltransferase family 92 protein n=1 Tax=Necator americanus TaxID=51031 RepID=W2TK07_NECAM|nr:hypothetical protein NECAME_17821 [Necator americanus]ETN81959.1 hypothetical protein NECAME_17821 [Necator americanus]
MYYHSSSRHVQDVLQHYQKEGFVTIIRWPSLPRSSFVDPNLSLYRLAHSLAHNDCVLRIDSEFGAVIDVDEIIVPRQGTLLGLLNELFSNSSVGALSFAHRSLRLNPPLAGQNFSFAALNYSGIKNATEFELQGPSKVPTKDAVLLHHRYNHVTGENPKMVNLLPSGPFINDLLGSLINQTNAIFPKGADFHFNTQKVLGMCLKP